MNCRSIELSFSPHYDGALGPAERTAFDAHLASCDRCRAAFAEFVRAIADLKHAKPGPTDPALIAAVMARVDREIAAIASAPDSERAPFAWRRAASHLVAAAIGAAAALAIGSKLSSRDPSGAPDRDEAKPIGRPFAESPVIEMPRFATTAPSIPVRVVGADGVVVRNDIETMRNAFKIRPGDRLRTLPSQRVEISVGENGELLLTLENEDLPAPVEKPPVNEIRFVELGPLVNVDREVVDHAVDTFETTVSDRLQRIDISGPMQSFLTTLSDLDRAAQATRAAIDAEAARGETPAAANGADPAGSVTSRETGPPDGAFEATTFTAGDSAVAIRTTGTRTALTVEGPLARTIPELIGLLDHENPEVVDLAAARLDMIRRDLEADPRIGRDLSPLPPESERIPAPPPEGLLGRLLHSPFGTGGGQISIPVPPARRWTEWWRANAVRIVTGAAPDA